MRRLFQKGPISGKQIGINITLMFAVAAMVLLMIPASMLFAADTGLHSPSVVTGWTNPQNSMVSDNVYTSAVLYSGQFPGNLVATGYGFNIPNDATINGIVVNVERYQQTLGSGGSFTDSMSCLVINGTPNYNANRAVIWTAWSASEENKIYGSPTDLWGLSLTPADINNPGFGFFLSPIKATGKAAAYVDYIGITVYYSMPDTTPPVINPQADINVVASSAAGAVVTFSPTATDNADPSVTVICTPPSGSLFPVGTTPVTANATDAAGNAAVPVTFNVIVAAPDTTPPVINPQADINVVASSAAGAVVTFSPTATDNADPSVTVICTPPSGSLFPVGTTPVTANATDAAGNAAVPVTFNVIVAAPDTTPPVINPQADINVVASSAAGAVVTFSPTATDNADPSVTVICTPPSGSLFPVGTTPVTANATDAAGNAAVPVTFNVIVAAVPSGGGGTPSSGGGGGAPATSSISVLGITNFSNGGSITDFVTRMYRTILLREPDPIGLADWVNALTNGGLRGSDVARGFVFSEEYRQYMASLNDTAYLNFLYNRFFGRPADLDGLNGWLNHLSNGMSREDVLAYFLDCEEWQTICNSYGVTP